MHKFLIPSTEMVVETEVKKSRFICHLSQAINPQEAHSYIDQIRKQYPEACHHCWAFQTEEPGSTRSIGCSDDGEPHGTAGKPMLNVLSHCDVGEIVAVVARIYGGTKLGTGGLARAYAESVKAALAQLKTKEKIPWQQAEIQFDYSLQAAIVQMLERSTAEILNTQFENQVKLSFRYDQTQHDQINQHLNDISRGKVSL